MTADFSTLFLVVQNWGYLIIYIAMVVEGPIVNSAASFAASLGYFNFFLVGVIAFLGDLTGDIIYYSIGRFGKKIIINKYRRYFKIESALLKDIIKEMKKNMKKTIVAIKLIPILAGPGLLVAGAFKVPFKKYLLVSVLTIIPTTLFFSLTGYYFGFAFDKLNRYFGIVGSSIAAVIFLFIFLPVFYKFVAKMIYKSHYLNNQKI